MYIHIIIFTYIYILIVWLIEHPYNGEMMIWKRLVLAVTAMEYSQLYMGSWAGYEWQTAKPHWGQSPAVTRGGKILLLRVDQAVDQQRYAVFLWYYVSYYILYINTLCTVTLPTKTTSTILLLYVICPTYWESCFVSAKLPQHPPQRLVLHVPDHAWD